MRRSACSYLYTHNARPSLPPFAWCCGARACRRVAPDAERETTVARRGKKSNLHTAPPPPWVPGWVAAMHLGASPSIPTIGSPFMPIPMQTSGKPPSLPTKTHTRTAGRLTLSRQHARRHGFGCAHRPRARWAAGRNERGALAATTRGAALLDADVLVRLLSLNLQCRASSP